METPRYLIFVVVIIAILVAMIPQNIFFFISLFDLIFKSKSGDVDSSVPKEQKCLNYINRHAIKGNATSVLNAIDKFGWEESFLMNVGDIKGQILTDELKKSSPKFVLEVGAYLGYSAVRIASQLPADSHLISVELSPLHISYARQTVEHAGLTDRVTFLEGTVPTTSLKSFLAQRNVENFDFIFLDHHKGFYLPDLKYLLSEKLIQPNATIVADNVLLPGAPDYWYYVIFDSKFSTKSHLSRIEYLPLPDIVTVSKFLGY
jgi:catechol O-methyltransferase